MPTYYDKRTKPCSTCGTMPVLEHWSNWFTGEPIYAVRCNNPDRPDSCDTAFNYSKCNDPEKAIAKWNEYQMKQEKEVIAMKFTPDASTISFDVNNQDKLIFRQEKHDAAVQVYRSNATTVAREIPAGDMVMLYNYYGWIRDNDIQNDFLNPYGKLEPLEIKIHSRQDAFNALAALEEYLLYATRNPEELEPFTTILHQMHDAAKTLVCQWHNLTGCKNQ